ncbi:MAG: ATP-binding protein, partial [Deltaproteobacteria bacterium]
IIMNLVINASEAIGEKSGIIAITTGCMNCDSHYLQQMLLDKQIPEGLYVYLEIADTGCGMKQETLAKIFDPFFTTKFTGRGLGMAAVLMGSLKILTTWYSPREFATLSGILIAIGNLGGIGATTPLAWLSDRLGWRGACGCMA